MGQEAQEKCILRRECSTSFFAPEVSRKMRTLMCHSGAGDMMAQFRRLSGTSHLMRLPVGQTKMAETSNHFPKMILAESEVYSGRFVYTQISWKSAPVDRY